VVEVQVPEAGQALHLREEGPGELALRRRLTVPVDAVVDDLVVGGCTVASVQELLVGQVHTRRTARQARGILG
jgi:hypothetical protein